jgi:hypothetical protein
MATIPSADCLTTAAIDKASAVLAPHWGDGTRHGLILSLAGMLLRKLSLADAEAVVRRLCQQAGDDEVEARLAAVRETARRLDRGEPCHGTPTLVKLLGPDGETIVWRLRTALGLLVTVKQLTKAKGLPCDYLKTIGLTNTFEGIAIPYRDTTSAVVVEKLRTAVKAGDGSRWPKGAPLLAYGLDRIGKAREAGRLTLVEGESDCWALWYHDQPALGLPGANTVSKTLTAECVQGIGTVIVVQEPDGAGASFAQAVASRLAELRWAGELRIIRLDGHKDPADLHVDDPDKFPERWRAAMDAAKPLAASGPVVTDTWEPPVPFAEYAVPPFPVAILPAWLGDYVAALAEATQTPPDLSAMLALATAGAALARKYRVLARPGWSQPLNLYAVVALPPGNRKSAVFREVTEPAAVFEREEAERLRTAIVERAAERRMLEGRVRVAEGLAAKSKDQAEAVKLREEAKELARELAAFQEPTSPQVIADDITPETVGKRLAELGGRLLVAGAEGTVFEIAVGRYSEQAHLDNFLKAHEGDRIRVDRIGRASDFVDDPALSMALAVQPCVIKGQAVSTTVRGKGFLARWLYAIPVSPVGRRKVASAPVPQAVASTYANAMLALWRAPGGVDKDGRPSVGWFKFGPEADGVLREFEMWLEPQLAEHGELGWIADWASKLAGAVVRIAGILHAAGGIGTAATMPATVPSQVAMAAVRLTKEYLVPHAQAAFGLIGADRRMDDAKRVLKGIVRFCESVQSVNGVRGVNRRDIHARVLGSRYSADEVDQTINLLIRHNYLRPAPAEKRDGPGRRPSPLYEINPHLLGERPGAPTPFTLFTESHNPSADGRPDGDGREAAPQAHNSHIHEKPPTALPGSAMCECVNGVNGVNVPPPPETAAPGGPGDDAEVF